MKILLGMSGGIDSTYAAHKLIAEGHTVEGAVLKMHGCTDVEKARETAEKLNIPIHIIDAEKPFEEKVISNFVSEYLEGRTPNPCVVCNREVKFRLLYDFALKNRFDAIATGHYARVVKRETEGGVRYAVSRGEDKRKDQTYMLWRLSQEMLSHLILPLADEEKGSIVEISRTELPFVADAGESQEICFIPDNDHASFIEARTGKSKRGSFKDEDGNHLGEHSGIIRYTVGQRKGLGIAMGKRMFVTRINAADNTVTLSEEALRSDTLAVFDMVFSGIGEPSENAVLDLCVKIRYQAPLVPCRLTYLGGGKCRVHLSAPQPSIAPGQSAVFYDGDDVVCGGVIVGV